MPGHVANSSISTNSTGVLSLLSSTTLATLALTAEPVHGLMASVMPSPPAGASPLAAGASVGAGASVADGSFAADDARVIVVVAARCHCEHEHGAERRGP